KLRSSRTLHCNYGRATDPCFRRFFNPGRRREFFVPPLAARTKLPESGNAVLPGCGKSVKQKAQRHHKIFGCQCPTCLQMVVQSQNGTSQFLICSAPQSWLCLYASNSHAALATNPPTATN